MMYQSVHVHYSTSILHYIIILPILLKILPMHIVYLIQIREQ